MGRTDTVADITKEPTQRDMFGKQKRRLKNFLRCTSINHWLEQAMNSFCLDGVCTASSLSGEQWLQIRRRTTIHLIANEHAYSVSKMGER